MNNRSFTKREWVFMIVIIITIQFLIQFTAWIYSEDGSIISYISFTGTIVSIILALLAIIYAFVQTLTQQNSSQKLNSQIDQLVGVVKNIESSESGLNDLLDHTLNISRKVDESIAKQELIESEIGNVKDKLEFFEKPEYVNGLSEPAEGLTDNVKELLSKKIMTSSVGVVSNILIIYYGFIKELTVRNAVNELSKKYVEEQESKKVYAKGHANGSMIALASLLNSIDLLSYNDIDEKYKIDQILIDKIEKLIKKAKEGKNKSFKEVVDIFE
ncbi:MAG: hypothetical protein WD607_08215 [Candidatus Paceibacterota bacterium]